MLQHTARHCKTLQDTARHCNTPQHTETRWNTLQHAVIRCNTHAATHWNTLQHATTHCNTLQHTATHCNTLQHTATHCNTRHTKEMCHMNQQLLQHTLHHTASHCNTLQHTVTHCNTLQHCNTRDIKETSHMNQHTLQHTRQHTLQRTLRHTATHCNTPQRNATHVIPRRYVIWINSCDTSALWASFHTVYGSFHALQGFLEDTSGAYEVPCKSHTYQFAWHLQTVGLFSKNRHVKKIIDGSKQCPGKMGATFLYLVWILCVTKKKTNACIFLQKSRQEEKWMQVSKQFYVWEEKRKKHTQKIYSCATFWLTP